MPSTPRTTAFNTRTTGRLVRSILTIILTATLLGGCSRGDFDTHSGGSGSFAQGQWLLINYWATWCGPCRKEIPDLNDFDQQRDDVVVYGINYDNLAGEALTSAIAEMGITFESMLQDPAPMLGIERPRVLPSTLLISPDGQLRTVLTGPQTEASLSAAIAQANGSAINTGMDGADNTAAQSEPGESPGNAASSVNH